MAMKKTYIRSVFFLCSISFLLLQGCTTDKTLSKKDVAALQALKVVRQKTPGILRSNTTENIFFTTAAIALPGGSIMTLIGDDFAKSKGEKMQLRIPDFGDLVMHKFIERLDKETALQSKCIVEDKPVESGLIYPDASIEFKVERLAYGYLGFIRGGGNGLLSKTSVTMKDPNSNILWQKTFTYMSKDFSREKELDALEVEDGKLLKEELEFAVEKTVSAFLEDLNGEKKSASN